jgi:hypothetical protein
MPQYLIDYTRKDRRKFTLRFNKEVTDSVVIEPYNFKAENWYLFEEHVMRDTFVYWIIDSLIFKRDSLAVLATYSVTDSMMNLVPFQDTFRLNYREPAKSTSRRRRDEEEKVEETEKLGLNFIDAGRREQDLHRALALETGHPVAQVDQSRIRFVKLQDSLEIPVEYSLEKDSIHLRRYLMKMEWEGSTSYELNLYPGAFTDLYGLTNDTIIKQIKTRNPEYYARILLNLSGVDGPKIIQVRNNKEATVAWKRIYENGLVEFDHLPPETFTLKLIHDRNDNGQWDSGDYLEHRQPEAVEFHTGSFTLRSNFDLEVNWEIGAEKENPPD